LSTNSDKSIEYLSPNETKFGLNLKSFLYLLILLFLYSIKIISRKLCPHFRPNFSINWWLILLKLNVIDFKFVQFWTIDFKTSSVFK
jgi:hypothetical protein